MAVRIRPSAPAGVAQWESSRMVGDRQAFDSLHRLQFVPPRKHCWRCTAPVKRRRQFDSGAGLQAWGRRSTGGLLACTQPMRVRFSPSPPFRLAAGANGSAPRFERGGSRFETWAASQFTAGRPIAQDAVLRTLKLGLESPLADHHDTTGASSKGKGLALLKRRSQFESARASHD
jgi:hypothetical protein